MARLINGINGPFIGKAGAVIGYTVNGVSFMKGLIKKELSLPLKRKPLIAKNLLSPRHG